MGKAISTDINWINAQAKIQHENNQQWWIDLQTGKRLNRNKGELLALIHSEVSEAWEGLYLFDDKLPKYNGAQVELADTLIRIFDFLGGFNIEIDLLMVYPLEYPTFPEFQNPVPIMFNKVHSGISDLLETYRKDASNELRIMEQFYVLINNIMLLSQIINQQIEEAKITEMHTKEPFPIVWLDFLINEKSEFNLNRADHKLEVRKSEGGKKF